MKPTAESQSNPEPPKRKEPTMAWAKPKEDKKVDPKTESAVSKSEPAHAKQIAVPPKPDTSKPVSKPAAEVPKPDVSVENDSAKGEEKPETDASSTTSSKPKTTFKLSAQAAEFTPTGFVPAVPAVPPQQRKKDKGNKGYKGNNPNQNCTRFLFLLQLDYQYPEGFYPPGDPYFYANQPQFYRPMMPRGYPPMPMPVPGQVPFVPAGFMPPQMYPGQMVPDMRPPFPPNGKFMS